MPLLSIDRNTVWVGVSRCSDISESQAESYRVLLSDEENARNKRFRFSHDRHRDLIARALLRCALGDELEIAPERLVFEKGRHGKPQLVSIDAEEKGLSWNSKPILNSGLEFNLSHAADWVVVALAPHKVGIDVEYTSRKNDVLAIADRYFFGAEIEELFSFSKSEQRERFFDYWTLKEAYMKARGEGISLGLSNFGFSLANAAGISINMKPCLKDKSEDWQFVCISPQAEYRLAIALNQKRKATIVCEEVIPLVSRKKAAWHLA